MYKLLQHEQMYIDYDKKKLCMKCLHYGTQLLNKYKKTYNFRIKSEMCQWYIDISPIITAF